jgi:hypothetical protein
VCVPELSQSCNPQASQRTRNLSRTSSPAAKPVAPLLSVLSDRYLKEKALSWATKEISNQKNYIGSFIKALGAIQNTMVTVWLDSTSIIPTGMSHQH